MNVRSVDPRPLTRVFRGLVAALALAVWGCGGDAASGTARNPAATPALRVVDGRLVDAHGRHRLLRGVNVKAYGVFDASFDDGRKPTQQVAPFDANDAQEIARLGFDLVRLCVSWSGLEPEEGAFSSTALARLDEVVGWLADAGLYVLIDFHEDGWSKEIGEDGAPLWAIVPPPPALLEGPLWPGPDLPCPCTGDGNQRRTSIPVLAAFASFFENRERIQERFVPVWQLVARRYAHVPAVIGYEAMNEPVVIHVAHGADRLEEFHRRMVAALRAASPRQAYLLEPDVVTRNLFWTAPGPRQPFPDDNVVYAAHLYPYVFPSEPAERAMALERTFDALLDEAARWGAAPLLGEWATAIDSPAEVPAIEVLTHALTQRAIGWALWQWKDYGSPAPPPGSGSIADYDWVERRWFINQPGTDTLTPPIALAVPGKLVAQDHDSTARRLTITFEARGGEGPAVLSVPEHAAPGDIAVRVDGVMVETRLDAGTRRLAVSWNGAPGRHEIRADLE